jgi:hypothetical protein
MHWEHRELFKITFGKLRKKPNKKSYTEMWYDRLVPVPYARLVQQFLYEDQHGNADPSLESFRRQAYVGQMLDMFAVELDRYKGDPHDFRSATLTPVLQRQLRGVPDAYSPTIKYSIPSSGPDGAITIADATVFYLAADPLHPRCIPSYRRNLIYIREARWHLAVLTGRVKVDSKQSFDMYLDNHDTIMAGLGPPSSGGIPVLAPLEVEIILTEGHQEFFAHELNRVVCTLTLLLPEGP